MYNEHYTLIMGIRKKNARAYHTMMHRLFNVATYVLPAPFVMHPKCAQCCDLFTAASSPRQVLRHLVQMRLHRSTSTLWTSTEGTVRSYVSCAPLLAFKLPMSCHYSSPPTIPNVTYGCPVLVTVTSPVPVVA